MILESWQIPRKAEDHRKGNICLHGGKHQPVGDMPVIGFHEIINHRILFFHPLLAEAKQH